MTSRGERARKHRETNDALRPVRKQIKRNRKPDLVRRKDWLPAALVGPDDADDVEYDVSERVMPRGERERRRAALATLLVSESEDAPPDPAPVGAPAGQHGIIVEVSSSLCRVDLDGRTIVAGLRGALSAADTGLTNLVAVGDEVLVRLDSAGRGMVEAVLPRKSALARPDVFYGHLQQVIVANVDQVLIVSAWREPAIWLELIDRYLIAAVRNNLAPVLCVNKIDLTGSGTPYRELLAPYARLGYRVLFTSARTGEGVAELRQILHGRTTALAGLSGVGKSSLLEAAQPGLKLRVGDVSQRHHEGRHTTAQARLWRLAEGGFVVDTPGIRSFGLSGLRRRDLAQFYPEIAAITGCRFANCLHLDEPGCAVCEAVETGKVAAERYHNYGKILIELPDEV